MKILDNPVTKFAANALSNIKPGSPLDDALEFIGILEPDKLDGLLTADTIGDVGQAFYEALGYDEEIAAGFGAAGDAAFGNVSGAVEKSAQALGADELGAVVELAGELPV